MGSLHYKLLVYLFTWLHFIHRSDIEVVFVILGLVCGSSCIFGIGIVIALFKLTITLNRHDMNNKVFKESKSDDYSLTYDGNIPVFSINSGGHYHRGFIHGSILHDYIKPLHYRMVVLSLFKSFPKPEELTIPSHINSELLGLVDGYNTSSPWIKLTYETALNWHLLPMACTTLIANESTDGDTTGSPNIIFARNMDWVPYGNLASYSLIIKNMSTGVSSFAIPGIVGVITAWSPNLILAMNVCESKGVPVHSKNGVPALFLNRIILEEVSDSPLQTLVTNKTPYGPYHVTVLEISTGKALVCSYYQSINSTHLIRKLDYNSPLITFNHTYINGIKQINGRFFSDVREEYYLKNKDMSIKKLFSEYPINNYITCHSLIFDVSKGIVSIKFDNGFAGVGDENIMSL